MGPMTAFSRSELLTMRLEALAREDQRVGGLLACLRGVPGSLYYELIDRHGWETCEALGAVLAEQERAIRLTAEEAMR